MSPAIMVNKIGKKADSAQEVTQAQETDALLELERIAYAISHNMQSPLRTIIACCDEIRHLPGSKSKPVDVATADLLGMESERLKEMMKLVVDYIQLDTHRVHFTNVDCNEVMETVKTMLATDIEKAGAILRYGNLPKVHGHQGRITRLFSYIIENAIKFCDNKPCLVDITAKLSGDFYEISVRDNGIGIAKDDQDIIFRLFKRLHLQESYLGYGAGLALARKIVLAHGGSVGVESELNQGSRFYFTLPVSQS